MIERGLFAYLSQVADVQAIITAAGKTRLYPLVIPQQGHAPCGVYQISGVERSQTYCGTIGLVRSSVQLDSYGRTYDDAIALARAFRLALTDFAGMMGDVDVRNCVMEVESDFEEPEPGLYRRYQSWLIWHIES